MDQMERDFIEIYDNMLSIQSFIPWVKSIWDEDSDYTKGYKILSDCRERLAERLNVPDYCDDEDLEEIMYALVRIEGALCRKMFYYTIAYAKRGYQLY
ncbi:MAG: hypothetical protein J6J12_06515 [Oscillospiraceae bacterium]|nr:hypothetical protein [Oscillospiraceae bacterium]